MEFKLGEQPDWAHVEGTADIDGPGFVEELLASGGPKSLIERGFCVVQITEEEAEAGRRFLKVYEGFALSPIEERARFAQVQFDEASFSPNQFHGYSEVADLKTQFMMRIMGTELEGSELGPLLFPDEFKEFGGKAFEVYDAICRRLEAEVSRSLGESEENLFEAILDPVNETNQLPPNYISSSILDNFHYLGGDHKNRFVNNHGSHTDSGLITLVFNTSEPGLEVLDQKQNKWIAIDRHVQEYEKVHPEKTLAIAFWGDSVGLLQLSACKTLTPCLHRVASTKGARFTSVFKQRPSPMRSAPRYQEDYPIAVMQSRALCVQGQE